MDKAPGKRYRFSDGDAKAPSLRGFSMNNDLPPLLPRFLVEHQKDGVLYYQE
jgi:hypothetical protein